MLKAPQMLIDEIRDQDFLSYVDGIGVAAFDAMHEMPNVLDIQRLLPETRSIVVLSAHMPKNVVERAGEPPAENGMSYSFVQYQLVRETLWAAQDLGRWLESKGERSFPVADLTRSSYPTLGPYAETKPHGLPDIRANSPFAAKAGLGALGLHGMLLTPEFGPRQRFSFLLTTAEFELTPYQGPDLCTHCDKCIIACPVQALSKDRTDEVAVNDRVYTCSYRQEVRCRWARSLGMIPGEGPACLGWKDPGLPVPDTLTEDEVQEAIRHKDPLQVIAYRYPFQTDVIIEQCLKACPVGKWIR